MAQRMIMIVDDEQTIKEITPDLVLLDLGFAVRGGDGFSILRIVDSVQA